MKYCIIGDLHGRINTLERIIEKSEGYHFIFLGDTIHHKSFFHRTKRTSPMKMLFKIKKLVDANRATLIIGNNENYIIKNLALPKNQIRHKEVKYTLECIKKLAMSDQLKLLHWLLTSPLTLQFETGDKTYRCAHAYYNPEYTDQTRDNVLTGLGYPWFRNDQLEKHLDQNVEYFFGHYGYPYFRKNLHIIDATNFEGVGVYYTDREEFLIYY